ncbi:helix-turn-helix domain-containing protein [Pseudohoeflea suaedae]|uniref:Helix-turn-helix domain-containing protein n=2 Tax=Pseudohoeflea suaedae TaxID=877384 RepID=A0A4R5PJ55_9HYPH|nr:helix-turn-helix domain-containing protein [Pseudohoeflea suaedae]
MKTLGAAIRRAREARGWSQTELGERVNLSVAAISKIENGGTRNPRNLARFAEVLGVDFLAPKPKPKPRQGMTPIVGRASAGNLSRIVSLDDPVDWAETPGELVNVPGGYMVYVHGDSMAPRYEPGERIHVNPTRPVPVGKYCVIQVADDGVGPATSAYVKIYRGRDDKVVRVEQLNPPAVIEFPAENVRGIHLVVGARYV